MSPGQTGRTPRGARQNSLCLLVFLFPHLSPWRSAGESLATTATAATARTRSLGSQAHLLTFGHVPLSNLHDHLFFPQVICQPSRQSENRVNQTLSYAKKPLTRVSKQVPGAHGKSSLGRGGRKGWRGLAGFLAPLQLCNSRSARSEDRICDSMAIGSDKNQKKNHMNRVFTGLSRDLGGWSLFICFSHL